jgi:hypothetical protein
MDIVQIYPEIYTLPEAQLIDVINVENGETIQSLQRQIYEAENQIKHLVCVIRFMFSIIVLLILFYGLTINYFSSM